MVREEVFLESRRCHDFFLKPPPHLVNISDFYFLELTPPPLKSRGIYYFLKKPLPLLYNIISHFRAVN